MWVAWRGYPVVSPLLPLTFWTSLPFSCGHAKLCWRGSRGGRWLWNKNGSEFPRFVESRGFFFENFSTWNVLENHFGCEKSWKLKLKVLISPGKISLKITHFFINDCIYHVYSRSVCGQKCVNRAQIAHAYQQRVSKELCGRLYVHVAVIG